MLGLKNDIENLLKIRLQEKSQALEITESELIKLSQDAYLFCWSTVGPCKVRYQHQMQLVCKTEGILLFGGQPLLHMTTSRPQLRGLQLELWEDWITDNLAQLNEMANILRNENIIGHLKPSRN